MSDTVVAEILQKISSGALSEGSQLPSEAVLCDQFGVSRSVIREAVRALSGKGFLISSQGSSTVVAPKVQWNVLDPEFLRTTSGLEFSTHLQEARSLLEPAMVRLAAERITPEQLKELRRIYEATEKTTDAEGHSRLDLAFHSLIAESTRNPVVVSLHGTLAGLGHRARMVISEVPGAIARANFWHKQVLEALEAYDAAAAGASMELHLRQVWQDQGDIPKKQEPMKKSP